MKTTRGEEMKVTLLALALLATALVSLACGGGIDKNKGEKLALAECRADFLINNFKYLGGEASDWIFEGQTQGGHTIQVRTQTFVVVKVEEVALTSAEQAGGLQFKGRFTIQFSWRLENQAWEEQKVVLQFQKTNKRWERVPGFDECHELASQSA